MNDFDYFRLLKMVKASPFTSSSTDKVSGKKLADELVKRDKRYTKLLDNYVKSTWCRYILKEIHKWIFFWLVAIGCVVGLFIFYRITNTILSFDDIDKIIDGTPLVITAMVSFIFTIIVVPVTITKYLFNRNEEDSVTKIIELTQKHDSKGLIHLKGYLGNIEKANLNKFKNISDDSENKVKDDYLKNISN